MKYNDLTLYELEEYSDEKYKRFATITGRFFRLDIKKNTIKELKQSCKVSNCINGKGEKSYYIVSLGKKGREAHIVLANKFIPKPKNPNNEKLVVHHRDGNKYNNHINNLIWLTYSQHSYVHNVEKIVKEYK